MPDQPIFRTLAIIAASAIAAALPAGAPPAGTAAPGDRVDIAAFGVPLRDAGSVGVGWENPRDVHEVVAVYEDPARTPEPDAVKLEWWGSVWPNNGSGGWMRLDDPWNGEWVPVAAKAAAAPGTISFTLPPLGKAEWKEAKPDGGPLFRRTLKVRLTGAAAALPPSLRVFGRSIWRAASFDIDLRFPADGERAGRIEVRNGVLEGIGSLPPPRGVNLEGTAWTARGVAGASAGVRARLLFVEAGSRTSNDITRVTVRLGKDPESTGFSFVPQDALEHGMRLRDFGALIAESSRGHTNANDPGPPEGGWDRTVRERLRGRPEMTRAAAMAGIPRLTPVRPAPLGAPSARQEPVVTPLGDWSMTAGSLHVPARDSERIPFRRGDLHAVLDTRTEPRFDGGDRDGAVRSLEDGHLPLLRIAWRTGEIEYRHALVATVLLGDIGADEARRGDETVVLLTRLQIRNMAGEPRTSVVNLRWSHEAPIELAEDGAVAIRAPGVPEGLAALRAVISNDRPAGGGAAGWGIRPGSPGTSTVLRLESPLAPGATRTIYFKAPFVDLLDPAELARLRTMSFEEEAPKVLAYWKSRIDAGMTIETPSAELNDFVRANLWHILITTDRDPGTGLYNQGAATFGYKVFANETVMIARSMDMRGERREAERFLEPLIRFQGSEALTGRFSTKDGVFHGAGAYTHGQYAMNHGFVLWGIADHYRLCRDLSWLDRVAPAVLKACDFLISERRSTMSPPGAPRSPFHGLAPASSLEDVVEFQYWLATNAYFHLGLKRAGQALAEAGHGEAGRILREAELYRRDIEWAARETATLAAAVRLRDGNWVPYPAPRVGAWRHLTEGWIREALYPSLHLATGEVVGPSDPLVTWILDDLEDTIFFSAESGYGVRDAEARWFERGAVTLQPCLLDAPAIYLARGEVEAALRSFWNAYALLIYPDIRCFAEWAKAFGAGGGPLYKTSDEARFVMWLRQLLIDEDGDRLLFGRGIPREWLEDGKEVRIERAVTSFGAAGLRIRSEADGGSIRAEVDLPGRALPGEVWLRLRHPRGLTPERVLDGEGRPLPPDRISGEDIRLVPGPAAAGAKVKVTAEYGA